MSEQTFLGIPIVINEAIPLGVFLFVGPWHEKSVTSTTTHFREISVYRDGTITNHVQHGARSWNEQNRLTFHTPF
jgi:hypothetical protein